MSWTTSRVTRRAAIRGLAATGLAMPSVFRAHAAAAPSETLYHASFGASGMAGADLHSLTASRHVKLVAVADVDLRNTADDQERVPRRQGLPGLARAARQGEAPRFGERLDTRSHARPDHHAGDAAGTARLHSEAPDPDHVRGPAAHPDGPREEAGHPDGHPDPFARDPPDGGGHTSGKRDRQGEGGP